MYREYVLITVFLLIVFCSSTAHKKDKRRLEILHKGKPLEELVNLATHVDPHDVNGLAESIEPKLMEETHQERMMLQQNGIEDPYPLDATIEYEHKKKLPKPIIATENNAKDKSKFSYEDPDDVRYDSNDMPEYGVETKADYQGNQEAADWLMHDPNKFNIMPDEDTKNLFSDEQDSSKEMSDDPIRLDNSEKQESNYVNYNDDNQEAFTKIQESLAPDTNMDMIYSKYEKYLTQMDQKIRDKNKNIESEDENNFANDVSEGSDATSDVNKEIDATSDVSEGHDVFSDVSEGNNVVNGDSDGNEVVNNVSTGNDVDSDVSKGNDVDSDVSKGNDITTQTGNNESEANDNGNMQNAAVKIGSSGKSLKLGDKISISKEEYSIEKQDESGTNPVQNIQEKIKTREENKSKLSEEQEAIKETNDKENKNGNRVESGRQGSKPNNEIDMSSSKTVAAFHETKQKTQEILPVYRISHLHRTYKTRPGHLRISSPLTELGTSRQLAINRKSFGINEFHQLPLNSEYGELAQLMPSRTRDEHPHQINSPVGSNHLPLQFNPQEPEDGQGRHGIPTKFGEWNGWSECSTSCDTGSQIRARICLRLPCQSRDLYQTKTCTRTVCPEKWRKESLRAHNHVRTMHHSPPLVWSNSLAKKAKQLADTLASRDYIASQDLHEENGENIAQLRQIKDDALLAQKAVELWYKEIKSYSYSYPELTSQNRHFVQMVWKNTKSLGMASTKSPSGEYTFVVALYGGPGIDNKHLHDNVARAGQKHDVYTTFKRSRPQFVKV